MRKLNNKCHRKILDPKRKSQRDAGFFDEFMIHFKIYGILSYICKIFIIIVINCYP